MAKQTELTVSYSLGLKAQIVKYELSQDVHVSRTEKWDVSDLNAEEVEALYADRYSFLVQELTSAVEEEYKEMMDK